MAELLTHRGPDDSGSWADPEAGIALGFRRLSIVELSQLGHQPMRSRDGRFVMVFNGEVYNHRQLKKELEAEGDRFHGRSDTEVVLAALARWGVEGAVKRFIGMFAIALWDTEARRLFLIRDRLGIKPLYYFYRPGILTFGSELKALRAAPKFSRSIDVDALAAFLRYLYIPAPATIYQDTFKLLPGHILTVTDVSAPLPSSQAYWSVDDVVRVGQQDPFEGSDEEAINELDRLLTDSVKLRMEADVPLGALLSGGIDSSTVVGIMQASGSRVTKTFTIGFDDPRHDEATHAARVAAHLGTDHTELSLSDADALNVIPLLPAMFDEPHADPSQIPTFLICKLAKQQVTVALTGDGGDELFGGYNRYIWGDRIMRYLRGIPRVPAQFASRVLGYVSSGRPNGAVEALGSRIGVRLADEKVRKVKYMLRQAEESGVYRSLLSAVQNPGQLLRRNVADYSRVDQVLEQFQCLSRLQWMMAVDQTTYLPDDLLAKVDRASMAVSLEARVPILDHRVVEFSWRMPLHLKVDGGKGKAALRRVLDRYVPRELIDRPKVGFSVPIAGWLRGSLRPWAESLLEAKSHGAELLDSGAIGSIWTAFIKGRDDTALDVWALLVFLAWCQEQ